MFFKIITPFIKFDSTISIQLQYFFFWEPNVNQRGYTELYPYFSYDMGFKTSIQLLTLYFPIKWNVQVSILRLSPASNCARLHSDHFHHGEKILSINVLQISNGVCDMSCLQGVTVSTFCPAHRKMLIIKIKMYRILEAGIIYFSMLCFFYEKRTFIILLDI